MANEHSDLKAKIDEEPLNAGRTDQEVLDWLNETEQGPWLLVASGEFNAWVARSQLAGPLNSVRQEPYTDSRAKPLNTADSERNAAEMLWRAYNRGEGLDLSSTDIRNAVAPAVGGTRVISPAQRDDLLAVARPDVPRWVNANWTQPPILGDVIAARALP